MISLAEPLKYCRSREGIKRQSVANTYSYLNLALHIQAPPRGMSEK